MILLMGIHVTIKIDTLTPFTVRTFRLFCMKNLVLLLDVTLVNEMSCLQPKVQQSWYFENFHYVVCHSACVLLHVNQNDLDHATYQARLETI